MKRVPAKPFKLMKSQRKDLERFLTLFVDELAAGPYDAYRSRAVDCCVVVTEALRERHG